MAAVLALQPLAPKPWPPAPADFMEDKENGHFHHHHPKLTIPHPQPQPVNNHHHNLSNGQTSPPGKERRRRERPCDGCRRRKSKCVLQDSRRCALCEFHKQECTFVEEPQPRKRKLDDNSRIDSAAKRSPVTTTSSTVSSSPQQSRPTLAAAQSWSYHPAPPNGQAHTLPHDESLSLQRHRHCKYLGQTTALDSSLIGLSAFNTSDESGSRVGTLRRVTGGEYFSTHADADVPVANIDEAQILADLEATVGNHGPALIDLYFRIVHPSYPIIQQKLFRERQRHDSSQINAPLLAAMYLLALNWWSHDSKLSQLPKPDQARLEYIAMTSLTIAIQRPSISAVQAGLLNLQRTKSNTWTLTVQLVALGQDLGLHLDCTDWSIPLWERRLRKRIAWALYMQDKWSALMHGRPSHINASDWAVPALTALDFDESVNLEQVEEPDPESAKGRTLFMQMISLTSIMADVCATFYSQSAKAEYARAGAYATQLVLNRAKPVQIKLKDWFAKLPAECKMDSFTPGQLCSNGYLHLGYFATEISIHRRIVQSLSPTPSSPSTSTSPSTATAAAGGTNSPQDQYILYIIRSAAKTRLISAMDFVNRLRPEHLDAFWFFPSSSNFALIGTFGALLMASSPGREEAEFYQARLREFRWTLGVSAEKAQWIRAAVEVLDANGEFLDALPEKERVAPAVQQQRRQSGGVGGSRAFGMGVVNGEEMDVEGWS